MSNNPILPWYKDVVEDYLTHFNNYNWPANCIILDLETSGLSKYAVILQIGILIVDNYKPVFAKSYYIDWNPDDVYSFCSKVSSDKIEEDKNSLWNKLQQKIVNLENSGKLYIDKSWYNTSKESPNDVLLKLYYDLFVKYSTYSITVYNGLKFDIPKIAQHMHVFGPKNNFENTVKPRTVDMGALLKASLCQWTIWPGEDMIKFQNRVLNTPASVHWSLHSYCMKALGLSRTYQLSLSGSHHATYDCYLIFHLLEDLNNFISKEITSVNKT
ncbi:MAG: hypothetical protein QXH92_04965 [Candidatus Aenigmatarchaeota archaeon]